jgi:hypothetical protein
MSYFSFFLPELPFTSRTSSTTIISKGRAQEKMGKESLHHLSARIPSQTANPTATAISLAIPA